jgi:hypothetical protein
LVLCNSSFVNIDWYSMAMARLWRGMGLIFENKKWEC